MKTHFLHSQIKYCSGYSEYIKNQRFGFFKFNLQYFFFSLFFLVRNKMYAEYFFISILYAKILNLVNFLVPDLNQASAYFIAIYLIIHLVLSFSFHSIYYIHADNECYKLNYDYEKSLKKLKPYPWYINLVINIVFFISIVVILSFDPFI